MSDVPTKTPRSPKRAVKAAAGERYAEADLKYVDR